ncbi:Autophagy-related protein 28 [Coniochaeta hoffmannii]|uniref:Autophagy-related protein 28 n=1 Tax=Coniochaeta hoffmannii TaxID=91930 RepID=A0AA38VEE0_9PEZI|nr:Autophagy-related protein 28 [Coniochaeta hoffmannii]
MTSKSSFLPRLSLSGGDAPVLPFHNTSSPPPRRQPSEYDLSDLSPRPDDALLPSRASHGRRRSSSDRQSSSPSARYSDYASSAGSESKNKSRILFAGPPPPIATSAFLYRDEEEDAASHRSPPPSHQRTSHGTPASFARSALTSVTSVLFERGSPAGSSPHAGRGADRQVYEPDTVWRNLQQREKALQRELQHILDIQSARLAANLDPTAGAPNGTTTTSQRLPSTRSDASDAGSATPRGGDLSLSSTDSRQRRDRHGVFDDARGADYGQVVIPVRQPRRKPMGLAAARAALARNMSVLADLKAEEDAVLTAALATRKKWLAQLKRLAGRRENIAHELRALESGAQEPLGQELRGLDREREKLCKDITELEERLAGMRSRKRLLDMQIQDVKNQREAGLSGYRNALKEVDASVSNLLQRPPVKPLDLDAMRLQKIDEEGNRVPAEIEQSPGGIEFLHLVPQRRTVDMARQWWDAEIKILEERKAEVDNERIALEQGVQVWEKAVKIVSDYEISLIRQMNGEMDDGHKGKGREPTLEEAMRGQLDKLAKVIAGLEELLRDVELRSWNLLICAIGAELEAFKQAEEIQRDMLRSAGFDDEEAEPDRNGENGPTPRLGRSVSGKISPIKKTATPENKDLVDVHDDTAATESDNEVPPDLLVAQEEEERGGESSPSRTRDVVSRNDEREDSENEVPREFLAEHDGNDEDE